MTITALLTDLVFSFTKFLRNTKLFKSQRLLRISRFNKAFKLLRFIRSFKFFRIIIQGFESFQRVTRFLNRILLCFPTGELRYALNCWLFAVFKLSSLLAMATFIFGCIGVELFHSNLITDQSRIDHNPYAAPATTYISFDSIAEAFLILVHVLTDT